MEEKQQREHLCTELTKSEYYMTALMAESVDNFSQVVDKIPNMQFIEPNCAYLFKLMKILYTNLGYTVINDFNLEDYFSIKKVPVDMRHNIMQKWKLLKSLVGVKKLEFYPEFDRYSQINSIYKFHTWVTESGGINEIYNRLMKLPNMEETEKVIEGRLSEFFTTGTSDASIKDTDITDMMDDKFITDIRKGENIIENVYLLPQFWQLNALTQGLVRGTTGFAGLSGSGKTSFMYSVYILSVLENTEDKICIYANEQTAKVFAIGIIFGFISQVINKRYKDFGLDTYMNNMSRNRLIKNKFSDEESNNLVVAIKKFKERYKNRVTHSYFEDMSPMTLKRDVAKKFREGHRFFFYDTFKDNDEDYQKIMKLSSTFDQLTKKLPIYAYLSLQMSDESQGVNYLTNKCLASAKGTKRIMETLILMRKIQPYEFDYLKVRSLKDKRPVNDIPVMSEYDDKNFIDTVKHREDYYALFIDKTRTGEPDKVLLMQINLDLLNYKEVGMIMNMSRKIKK